MELGTSTPFWDMPFKKYGYLVSATWTSHIWDYLSQCNVRLHDENQWTYTPPRTNDSHLMDIVLDTLLDKHQKSIFNQVRMFMKVITISDVYDADRKKIKEGIFDCTVP